jgi:hypothetical protein
MANGPSACCSPNPEFSHAITVGSLRGEQIGSCVSIERDERSLHQIAP